MGLSRPPPGSIIITTMSVENQTLLHASCVAYRDGGLLILGASGAGKSSLALEMMAFGATLVADDQVCIRSDAGRITADCPASIRGRIEARGVGILAAPAHGPVRLTLAVDLDRPEPDRLPACHKLVLLGTALPLVLGQGRVHLAPVLLQYLAAGRWDDKET